MKQLDRLASFGRMTAEAAHEIKNPLNFVYNFSELIASELDEMELDLVDLEIQDEVLEKKLFDKIDSIKKMSQSIYLNGERVNQIIEKMIYASNFNIDIVRPNDLNLMIRKISAFLIQELPSQIEIKYDLQKDLPLTQFSLHSLSRVFYNILESVYFLLSEASLPEVKLASYQEGEFVFLTIKRSATGAGAFAAKEIGLDLPMLKKTIEELHRGTIEVENIPSHFSKFIIKLPCEEK